MLSPQEIDAIRARIGTWGGSCAVRLPKLAVETLGVCDGQHVRLTVEDGAIVLRPEQPAYTLAQLVEEARRHASSPASLDDAPRGREEL